MSVMSRVLVDVTGGATLNTKHKRLVAIRNYDPSGIFIRLRQLAGEAVLLENEVAMYSFLLFFFF